MEAGVSAFTAMETKSVMFSVNRFYSRNQLPNEPVKDYLTELENLAQYCQFGEFLSRALRDKFVLGLNSESMQSKLFIEDDLTLNKAIDLAVSLELTCEAVQDLYTEPTGFHVYIKQEQDTKNITFEYENFNEDIVEQLGVKCDHSPSEENQQVTSEEDGMLINSQINHILQLHNYAKLSPASISSSSEESGEQNGREKASGLIGKNDADDLQHTSKADRVVLEANMLIDPINKLFKCLVCNRVLKERSYLHRHMLKHNTPEHFNCSVCDKSFSSSRSRQEHELIHSGKRSFRCTLCEKGFFTRFSLKFHYGLKHHDADPSIIRKKVDRITPKRRNYFLCLQCGKNFKEANKLRLHIMRHQGIKPYKCSECQKTFVSIGSLNTHMLTHNKPHKCTQCERSFTYKYDLTSHIALHTGEKPYSCTYCEKRFRLKKCLKEHVRSHTGEKPFVCTMCGFATSNMKGLSRHMRSHTGEKLFHCEQCSKSFAQKTSYDNHMRVHSGERPFSCELCGKTFARKCIFKSHQQAHSDVRPFICPICGKDFKWKSNLRTHRLEVHKLDI